MRDTAYYRRLPYTRKVDRRADPDGTVYFLASIEEIPPLRIHGSTREEALLRLDEIFNDVIESMLENGEEVPEPEFWPGHEIAGKPLPFDPDPKARTRRLVAKPKPPVRTVGADHVELWKKTVKVWAKDVADTMETAPVG